MKKGKPLVVTIYPPTSEFGQDMARRLIAQAKEVRKIERDPRILVDFAHRIHSFEERRHHYHEVVHYLIFKNEYRTDLEITKDGVLKVK